MTEELHIVIDDLIVGYKVQIFKDDDDDDFQDNGSKFMRQRPVPIQGQHEHNTVLISISKPLMKT